MSRGRWVAGTLLVGSVATLVWLFIRPMPFFVVTEAFERPVDTSEIPAGLVTLRAEECGACHQDFYDEWSTTIHSQAWTDPYFQVDWAFEDEPQICRNCHTPLDRQQPETVLGFRDRAKWDPILEPNPNFDPELQHEGVTCAGCHLRNGKILGPYGENSAPHEVERLENSNEVCLGCHVADGERWDTFLRVPACGTVTEIQTTRSSGTHRGRSGETVVESVAELGCVDCHMPAVERPIVEGGPVRPARQHLWRGGHDPRMVTEALDVSLQETTTGEAGSSAVTLTLTNDGAAHYLPTGTPDRHLTVELRALDASGNVVSERTEKLIRRILWRPFIVDLWDTRLPRHDPRSFSLEVEDDAEVVSVEAVVRYHLLEESRRRRIGYENREPIAYDVFRETIELERP